MDRISSRMSGWVYFYRLFSSLKYFLFTFTIYIELGQLIWIRISYPLTLSSYPFKRPSNDIINHKFIKEQGSMLNTPFLYLDTQHLICKNFHFVRRGVPELLYPLVHLFHRGIRKKILHKVTNFEVWVAWVNCKKAKRDRHADFQSGS